MSKKFLSFMFFVFINIAVAHAQAAQLNLAAGDVVTLEANSTTTVACSIQGSNLKAEKQIVARNCFCRDGIVLTEGGNYYEMIMRLVYSDGSTKDVVAQQVADSSIDSKKECDQIARRCR